MIKLIEKIDILQTLKDKELMMYIIQTTNHVTIDYLKRGSIQRKILYYGNQKDLRDDIEELEEEDFRYDERLEDLADALKKMPQKEYNLLINKYFFNKTDKEIAASIGINENSVRQYLTRARRRAKRIIEKM